MSNSYDSTSSVFVFKLVNFPHLKNGVHIAKNVAIKNILVRVQVNIDYPLNWYSNTFDLSLMLKLVYN